MLIENSDALKKYLMESLARISDADPGALSKYILALLKKPRSEEDLKIFFLDQLEVFLMKDTAKFVEQLFEAIKSKSYLEPSDPKQEKSETSEKDNQSSENHKSKRRGKSHVGTDSYDKKNQPLSFSSSRSRSSSPEKSGRTRENDSHSAHMKETLNDGSSFLKSREAVPLDKPPPEPVHSLINTQEYTVPPRIEKLSIRCKDYDERGYCLLGDSCPFNHGLDPVIVEDVSCLNFAHMLNDNVRTSLNVCERKESPLPPPPPPLPPLPPPPLPPTSPPPLPSSLPTSGIGYIPEPYNPECPAMGQPKRDCENYFNIPLQRPFQVPSHISSQTQSSMQQRLQNSKPVRSRELIGVPTVDSKNDVQSASNKRKGGFDYSRLGPKPKRFTPETTTIELRRVPQTSNTITTLHDHFSRFGKIMNIQVCYDDDPEAALITFATFAEANAAYRSTEAVLNNRFIKVFLHNANKRGDKNKDNEQESSTSNAFVKKDNLPHPAVQKNFPPQKSPNEAVVYSKGNLSKTVYLKKINNAKTDVPSVSSQGKGAKDEKKNTVSKLDLYKKKQEILEGLIQQQKLIFERLKTARKPKQREGLKQIIEELSLKIKALENELKCFFEKEKCISQNPKSLIAEKKKELLDAEMDLYKTLNKGDEHDTTMLLMKVRELKEKAFGLLESPYAKSGLRRKLVKTNVHNFSSKPVANFSKLLKTDNRPKSLLVSGVENKDVLIAFLRKFPGVEKVNSNVSKGCTVILNSRKAAENMLHAFNGFKFGNEILAVSWFQDDQPSVSEDIKDAKEKNDDIQFVEGEEDEDEEEDSEARSWRR